MADKKTIGICCDHAGYQMKEYMKSLLEQRGLQVVDYGCYSEERADYPDFAHAMGRALDAGEIVWGVATCGSGNGISMALNKHQSVRAALCWSVEIAALARNHNDANVLSIPARFIDQALCKEILETFLEAEFEGGRHTGRVSKIPFC